MRLKFVFLKLYAHDVYRIKKFKKNHREGHASSKSGVKPPKGQCHAERLERWHEAESSIKKKDKKVRVITSV
jgi:hypothetical protein